MDALRQAAPSSLPDIHPAFLFVLGCRRVDEAVLVVQPFQSLLLPKRDDENRMALLGFEAQFAPDDIPIHLFVIGRSYCRP